MRGLLGTMTVIGVSAAIAPIVRARIEPEPMRREKQVAVVTPGVPVDVYLDSFDRARLFGGTKDIAPASECSMPIEVLDVVLVDGMPGYSVAAIREKTSDVFSPVTAVQRGDRVLDATVVAVDAIVNGHGFVVAGVVELERDGTRMRCAGGGALRTTIADAPPGIDGGPISFTREEIEKAIQSDVYVVRADPVRENGGIRGWKLTRVPGTALARAGLANGDVIRRVNGYEIDGTKRALELFAQLQNERDFTVDYERGGKPNSVRVRIR